MTNTNPPTWTRRMAILWVLILAIVALAASPATAGGDKPDRPKAPSIAVADGCDWIEISNTGKVPAPIAAQVGDGYVERTLAAGETKRYTGGAPGNGWSVYLDAAGDGITPADKVDGGTFRSCDDDPTSTTSITTPPSTSTTVVDGVPIATVVTDCDLVVTNTSTSTWVSVTVWNGDTSRTDPLGPNTAATYAIDWTFGWAVTVADDVIASGDPGSVSECDPDSPTDSTTTTVLDPTETTVPEVDEPTTTFAGDTTTIPPTRTSPTLPFTGPEEYVVEIAVAVGALVAGLVALGLSRRLTRKETAR